MPKTVTVEFVLVGKNDSPITSEDAECMSAVAESIRLSARLVDMPCQDMHTSAFVQVNINNTVEITIDHFTVVCSVTCPLNGSEAGGDLALIQTSLLLSCKCT